jgi:hypothetical protein
MSYNPDKANDAFDDGFSAGYAARTEEVEVGEEQEHLTLEHIKRMPQEEINRRWKEVCAVLEASR